MTHVTQSSPVRAKHAEEDWEEEGGVKLVIIGPLATHVQAEAVVTRAGADNALCDQKIVLNPCWLSEL